MDDFWLGDPADGHAREAGGVHEGGQFRCRKRLHGIGNSVCMRRPMAL